MIAVSVRGRARKGLPSGARALLLRRLGRAMRAAGVGEAELSLSLVDDDEIHALNRAWRDKNKPTDVLSFSMREGAARALPTAGAEAELLGDVIISVETAARQAEAAGRGLDEELLHLSAHGLAHLLGYDHATKREERVMFGFEAALRDQALARGPVAAVALPPWPPTGSR